MRVTKELFEKLSKKNQIEYKERIKKIRDIELPMIWVTYTKWFVYFWIIMLFILPLWKLAFGWEIIKSLSVFMRLGVKVFGLLFVIGIGIDIGLLMIQINKINKIRNEYFKIEVRDEKSNRNSK